LVFFLLLLLVELLICFIGEDMEDSSLLELESELFDFIWFIILDLFALPSESSALMLTLLLLLLPLVLVLDSGLRLELLLEPVRSGLLLGLDLVFTCLAGCTVEGPRVGPAALFKTTGKKWLGDLTGGGLNKRLYFK
jgi:hypothetical protein